MSEAAPGFNFLSAPTVKNIRRGIPFKESDDSPFVIGYKTKGGTYILATSGRQLDSGKPRDAALITFSGNVVPANPFVNPDFIEEIEKALATDA